MSTESQRTYLGVFLDRIADTCLSGLVKVYKASFQIAGGLGDPGEVTISSAVLRRRLFVSFDSSVTLPITYHIVDTQDMRSSVRSNVLGGSSSSFILCQRRPLSSSSSRRGARRERDGLLAANLERGQELFKVVPVRVSGSRVFEALW